MKNLEARFEQYIKTQHESQQITKDHNKQQQTRIDKQKELKKQVQLHNQESRVKKAKEKKSEAEVLEYQGFPVFQIETES